ncbi:hypothetical protein TTHERM_01124030 (macronuclear) [Tetrahymena thermophila SB210]|uniref:Uncharacterized protein n=1 Tax=Tetrahymena thermophila (strain SB210) TaxID=312017 RepID=Q22B35_TETTS|nr:hypothetical protein TTHERM_01124030 [Tetrahymena thermophila SB210]EAR82520.3 hypothetical protein TTHERM_01124030 [Tetrahymena thermophila SB210]|eukprot:XP_001030183.3 hypothetical protein TTHERM_01124030 [Tetrahymena thermophila SB210]
MKRERKKLQKREPVAGFEPAAFCLQGRCTNHCAIQAMEPVAGFEPAAFCLQGRCTNHCAIQAM